MILTGVLDVDINIISFCDFETIGNLLILSKDLVYYASDEIIKSNLDNVMELAGFIIDIIDINELMIVMNFIEMIDKIFDEEIRNETENSVHFDYYYDTILSKFSRTDVLEIYFTSNCNFSIIIEYLKDRFDSDFGLLVLFGFNMDNVIGILDDIMIIYQAAVNSDNNEISKFMLDYCENDLLDHLKKLRNHVDYKMIDFKIFSGYMDDIYQFNSVIRKILTL